MVAPRRQRLTASRRRIDDEGEDEGGPVTGGADDDSMSEVSGISDGDEDADAEGSEGSDDEAPRVSVSTTNTVSNGQTKSVPSDCQPVPTAAPAKSSFAVMTDDTAAMMNGLSVAENVSEVEEVHFDDMGKASQHQVAEFAPAALITDAPLVSNSADRRKQEHEEYRKRRDADPAFVPNRGGFFMHDHRSAAAGQNGFRPFGRGRGRGRAGFGGPQASAMYASPYRFLSNVCEVQANLA